MQISERKLNRNLEKQIFQIFYQLIADLREPEEVKMFFEDFLNRATRLNLAKKLMIALFLDKKRGYKDIKETLKVSSSTVAEVYKNLGNSGIQLALEKIKAEEWAKKWSERISVALGKILLKK